MMTFLDCMGFDWHLENSNPTALMDWARGSRDQLELDVFEANEEAGHSMRHMVSVSLESGWTRSLASEYYG